MNPIIENIANGKYVSETSIEKNVKDAVSRLKIIEKRKVNLQAIRKRPFSLKPLIPFVFG
jgi:hypothetical protein